MKPPAIVAPSAAPPALPLHGNGQWQVRVLGAFEARSGDVVISRWPSQPTALLLAALLLEPGRSHAREALIERLWPGAPPEAGRNRLRQALSTLRKLMTSPGAAGTELFIADRHSVRLDPAGVSCDAVVFEQALAAHRFADARAAYGGELLPGVYEDWVVEARARYAARFEALDSLALSVGQAPPARQTVAPAPLPPMALSLPASSGPLLGRDAELQHLLGALPASRLLTLTGPGGCGKTRLALEVARRATGYERVVFVPLADCADAGQAASQLRACLQLPPAALPPLEQAAQVLASHRTLLVLDNFEQVDGGAALLATLLARVPGLALLVTSRRPAGVDGEREVALAPLPLPAAGAPLEAVARNASVALFVQNARGVRPEFQVTLRNFESLAALCRALEGLPLAIELAAARSRAFSLQEMLQALAQAQPQPLELLARSGVRRRSGARHDSMRNAVAWSWRLLEPEAREMLAALSVFRGGWTAADAAVVTGHVADPEQARLLLEGLAADSLVRCDAVAEGSGEGSALRFRPLEVIREYAASELDPARALALRSCHRAHFLAALQQLPADQPPADDDLPNLEQALRSAVADGVPEEALRLALALQPHWARRGIGPDLLALLTSAAAALADGTPLLAPACTLLAQLQLDAGDLGTAQALVARALAHAGTHPAERAAALCAQVRVVAEGERRADGLAVLLDEALALAVQAQAPGLQARATELQAALAMRYGKQPQRAEDLLQQADALYRRAGQPRSAQRLRYERALCLREMGRLQAALEQAELSEVECARADDGVHRVRAINLQGVLLAELRRWSDAVDAYRRCVREAWAHHVHYWLGFALWNHGRNLARLRKPELAAQLMAHSERYWVEHFGPLQAPEQRFVRQVRRLVRVQIGRARTQQAWVEGASWTLAQAVGAALGGEPA